MSVDNALIDYIKTMLKDKLLGHWDVSKTWVNIGTAYVDVYVGTGEAGKPIAINTKGARLCRLVVQWNKLGTGTQSIRLKRTIDSSFMIEIASLVTGNNDSGWMGILSPLNEAEFLGVLQAKSTTSTDDPIFIGASLYLRY